jgi:hypothetical protein
MADTITTTVPIYMPVLGQWILVEGGSTVVVPSAASFASSHVSNVQLGTGTLYGGKTTPGNPFRQR